MALSSSRSTASRVVEARHRLLSLSRSLYLIEKDIPVLLQDKYSKANDLILRAYDILGEIRSMM